MSEFDFLRSSFNSAAQDYDAIRPGYPDALIADIFQLSGIPEDGQALEIGCGTGQATLPFARHGLHILCLDIGADLLTLAADNLRDYPNVQFRHISFEAWPARVGKFDLVYSATAFHWIAREIGYPKTALALKPGGALAVFSNQHPRPLTGFFEEVQTVYRQYVPQLADPREFPSTATETQAQADYIRSTGYFCEVIVRTYAWTQTYSTFDYLRLLNTYSNHLVLEPGLRRSLYQGIAELIERRYGGKIQRPYLSVLYLCKKK